ncbi:type II secretion system F family protein [Candidatus Woesearchaeota archaeon]|nr:type II secretion system F family protein [Candidatus Woesearchaeota archaeon]
MNLKFEGKHQAALIIAMALLIADFYLFYGRIFFVPFLAIILTVAWFPYWAEIFAENRRQKELESRFPEFVRNLTGAIKSGMPAASAVIHVAESDYGALTPYVKKLANQIEWAIPFRKAFINFGKETNNPVIKRAIATVIQAEQAGGNIEDVLYSITESLIEIKKIREERKSSIHSQIMQSYIIFFVFLGVMIIIQNLLIPYMTSFSGGAVGIVQNAESQAIITKVSISISSPSEFAGSVSAWILSMYGIFLMLSLIQGFFAGVVLGKLAEGDMTSGLKHSLIMMTFAFIIITLSQAMMK